MKTIMYSLMFLVGGVCIASANRGEPSTLTLKTLTITSDDGQCSISIGAGKDSVGLWVMNKRHKSYSYLFTDANIQPYFGLGDLTESGDPLAFYISDGVPTVQQRFGKELNIGPMVRLTK